MNAGASPLVALTSSSWVRAIVWGLAGLMSLAVLAFRNAQPERLAEIEVLNWFLVFLFFNVLWYEMRYRAVRRQGSLTQGDFLEICAAAQRADAAATVALIGRIATGNEAERRLAGVALANIGLPVMGMIVVAAEQSTGASHATLLGVAAKIADARFTEAAALSRWWTRNRARCQEAESRRTRDAADRRLGLVPTPVSD